MVQASKNALVVTDGLETSLLPSRFAESPKSTMLQYTLDSLWTVADDITVVFSKEPSLQFVESISPFGAKVVVDKKARTTLAQIVVGLRSTGSEASLVVPSNSPFVKPNVLFHLFESLLGYDAAVPRWKDGKTEPLLSVYNRKSFLRSAGTLRSVSLAGLVDDLESVNYVEIERFLKPLDPELHSFFQITTPKDMQKARKIASSIPK